MNDSNDYIQGEDDHFKNFFNQMNQIQRNINSGSIKRKDLD